MGFYFRKSKSVGPFKLNFSKSGVGVSTGVKGARLSMGPNGTYINVGKNGVYYRKKISGSLAKKKNISAKRTNSPEFNYENPYSFTDAIRVSASSENMSELGNAIIKDIKRAKAFRFIWFILLVALFSVISWWAFLPMLLLWFFLPKFFNAIIKYDLDSNASLEWEKYSEIINMLKSSKRIWIVESSKLNSNTKYNAGASRKISRSTAWIKRIKPKHNTGLKVKTDVPSVVIKSGICSLLFLPSDVIIKKGAKYAAYSYDQLIVYASTTNFVESSIVPRDAEIIEYTWQYVNKDGTRDKRFNNNVQIPVCRYGLLHLMVGQEMSIELHTSNKCVVENVGNAYEHYRSFVHAIESADPSSTASDFAFEDPIMSDVLQNSYNEVSISIRETGDDLTSDFSQWLSCKVSLIDSQYYYDHPVFYYKASKDVSDMIPLLEKTLNEQWEYNLKLDLVSDDSFLVHLYMDVDLEFSDPYVKLSPTISAALDGAKRWSEMHDVSTYSDTQENSYGIDSISVSKDGVLEDKPFTIEEDLYSHIFESDDTNGIEDTGLIDDMLMFLNEE